MPAILAVNDTVSTLEGNSVQVNVLDNDIITGGAGNCMSFASIVSVSTPTSGTATLGANSITFSPAGVGSASFTYTLEDPVTQAQSTATVFVTVIEANAEPTAAPDSATVTEDQSVTIDVTGNDSDPDATDVLTLLSVTAPTHGMATVDGGLVSYTPDPSYYGSDSFSYTVSDGHEGTASAVVSITVHSDMAKHQSLYDGASSHAHQAYLAHAQSLSAEMESGIAIANASAQSDADSGHATYLSQEATAYSQYGIAFDVAAAAFSSAVTAADNDFAFWVTSEATSLMSTLQAVHAQLTTAIGIADGQIDEVLGLSDSIGAVNEADVQAMQTILDSFQGDPNDPAAAEELQALLAPYATAISSRHLALVSAFDGLPVTDLPWVTDALQAYSDFSSACETAKVAWHLDHFIAEASFSSSSASALSAYSLAEAASESAFENAVNIAESVQASAIIAEIDLFTTENEVRYATYSSAESTAQQQLSQAFAFAALGTPAPQFLLLGKVTAPELAPGMTPPGLQDLTIAALPSRNELQLFPAPPTAPQSVDENTLSERASALERAVIDRGIARQSLVVARDRLREAAAAYGMAIANGAPALDLITLEAAVRIRTETMDNCIRAHRAATLRVLDLTSPIYYVPLRPR